MADFISLARGLAGLDASSSGGFPVDEWNPAHCGTLDMTIRADGQWIHEGSPIGRPELVHLFAKLLRRDAERDGGGYVLVTPVEKLSITVEDAPFLAVDASLSGGAKPTLTVRTNVGDEVRVGDANPLVMRQTPQGDSAPYVTIRGRLEARFTRAAYYRLVEAAELRAEDGHAIIALDGYTVDLGSFEEAGEAE